MEDKFLKIASEGLENSLAEAVYEQEKDEKETERGLTT